jgi:hypothetical protein
MGGKVNTWNNSKLKNCEQEGTEEKERGAFQKARVYLGRPSGWGEV